MKQKLVNIVFLVGIFCLFFNHSLPDRQSGSTKIALSNDQMSLIEGKGCSTLEAIGAITGTVFCLFTFDPFECGAAAIDDIGCLLPDGSDPTGQGQPGGCSTSISDPTAIDETACNP